MHFRVTQALQNLGPFLLPLVLIWHYAGKGTLRHLRLHKVAYSKVANYILEPAFASSFRSEDWKWLLSQCSNWKRLGSSRGSALKCVDSQGVSYFSFIPPNSLERLIMISSHHDITHVSQLKGTGLFIHKGEEQLSRNHFCLLG